MGRERKKKETLLKSKKVSEDKPLKITPRARHGKFKRSSGVKNFFKVFSTSAIVLLLSSAAVFGYAYYKLTDNVETIAIEPLKPAKNELKTPQLPSIEPKQIEGAYNMLIIGSDSREGQIYQDGEESQLNDVTMLLQIDEDHSRVDIVSFPRDIVLDYNCINPVTELDSGLGPHMLNQALALGGPSCVSGVIEEIVGETIDSAVIVNFDSVMSLTSAIGGVPICFTGDVVNYNSPTQELLFTEGQHKLEGMAALDFLRERKGFYDGGDLGRVENQKLFIQAFLQEMKKEKIFLNPVKLYELANISLQNLTMTEDLTNPERLVSIAHTIGNIPQENISLHTIPTLANPQDTNRLILDETSWEIMQGEINTSKIVVKTEKEDESGENLIKNSIIIIKEKAPGFLTLEERETLAKAKPIIDVNDNLTVAHDAPRAVLCG